MPAAAAVVAGTAALLMAALSCATACFPQRCCMWKHVLRNLAFFEPLSALCLLWTMHAGYIQCSCTSQQPDYAPDCPCSTPQRLCPCLAGRVAAAGSAAQAHMAALGACYRTGEVSIQQCTLPAFAVLRSCALCCAALDASSSGTGKALGTPQPFQALVEVSVGNGTAVASMAVVGAAMPTCQKQGSCFCPRLCRPS